MFVGPDRRADFGDRPARRGDREPVRLEEPRPPDQLVPAYAALRGHDLRAERVERDDALLLAAHLVLEGASQEEQARRQGEDQHERGRLRRDRAAQYRAKLVAGACAWHVRESQEETLWRRRYFWWSPTTTRTSCGCWSGACRGGATRSRSPPTADPRSRRSGARS